MIHPDLRVQPTLRVLSEEQVERLHAATLEVLERVGVRMTHPQAREILHGAGARVDGERVRIPAWMVENAIRSAPPRVILGKRGGERSLFLEGRNVYFGPSVDCVEYLDPITDARRPFTSDDCRVTATVADALPDFAWVMTIGMAADAPANIADRVIARQVLTYTEKPLVFCCRDAQSARDIYEMAVLIAGSEERFRQAPTVVQYAEPVSPLVHYRPAVEKLLFCAEKGIPQVYYPCAMAGATAPASFAGTIIQGSAESLSGLVLAQLVRPGTPFIYGALASVMDMSTTIFSYGAPEMTLMVGALAQMAQRYRLPFFGTAGCSDAKFCDAQAGVEAAFSCLFSALSGANLVHDCGWLDHAAVASPAYMVLVHEVLQMVNQVTKGVPVNSDSLAVDVIEKVSPGGNYLTEDHTLAHFRNVFYSRLFDRTIKQQWAERGSQRFEERLQEATRQAMAHQPAPLPPDVLAEMERMSRHWQ